MSDNLPEKTQTEEVDLGQLFNAIGRLFEKVFGFIVSVFKALFKTIIYSLKPVINNIKLVGIVIMLATILGFVADKFKEKQYISDMLVRPYFDSKYQLANNVNYFNALINSNNINELADIFEIDTIQANQLRGFSIKIGPETQNDLLKEYNDYRKSIDSTLANDISYEDFIENRDILSGSVFSIEAKAVENGIFQFLERGFVKTFENEYSKKLKRIRDSSLLIKKATYKKQLERIDSLQRTYLEIKVFESKNSGGTISSKSIFPIVQEKTETREFDLFREEVNVREKLRAIEETLIEESDYYDILSGFEEVGRLEVRLLSRQTLLFPVAALILMAIIFYTSKVYRFIKNYDE
ncbi:hypothetical protein J4050_00665 [Winogradskyella sp. DF17]|uniref:Lipopolysaccharide biosynthesis protein n=1 Tax=Winogradskyella pelagia TaxID=2819984 RepID=A0ABS3SXL5_9FLAO|nr:hypothetical protein [Winogradskyella sp. DF17]MBO3115237.1 hypothetical protein [Winogradskyella sp. DF17]